MDRVDNRRGGTALAALGVSLGVSLGVALGVASAAVGPAVAFADDTEPASADSVAHQPVPRRGAATPNRPARRQAPDAGPVRRQPATVTVKVQAPDPEVRAVEVPAHEMPSPEVARAVVAAPVAAAVAEVAEVVARTAAGPAREAPAAHSPVASPVAARPAAAVTVARMPSAAAATPTSAATGRVVDPLNALTAALAMFTAEINRLFFNRTPTAGPVQYTSTSRTVVTGTAGGFDPDGDPLAYSITAQPSHGTVSVDPSGQFTYTAGAHLIDMGGTDAFIITVRDKGFHLNFWVPTSVTVPVSVTIAAPAMPDPPAAGGGGYVDLMTFGMFHGSSHTGMDALAGGRTAITTEALVAYNNLRRFHGLAPATLEDVGRWAFAHNMTNNAQAWDNDLKGVGLYYAMQGAKVGWIADDSYDPQIVADIERTARLGSEQEVMAMVARYGQDGYAKYLTDNGYQTAFIDTLKMEPHYAGWMHDRANGRLIIEAGATAHDLNHLTVLSHDQTRPFMNDTWDWPQWPALDVSDKRVIEYFQSMVALGDPRGENLG